jgi:hypothetical protein
MARVASNPVTRSAPTASVDLFLDLVAEVFAPAIGGVLAGIVISVSRKNGELK